MTKVGARGVQAAVVAAAIAAAPSWEVVWERALDLPRRGVVTGFTADLDGDGRDEVVLHRGLRNEPSQVVALRGSDGEELWRAAFPERSCAIAADLDSDGRSEVVVACARELSVLDGGTGETVRTAALRSTIGDLACLRGDRTCVVYTAGRKRDDILVVLGGADLSERWSRHAAGAGGPFAAGFTRPTALDVDADGRDELVVVENGNHLLCLSWDGEILWDVGLGRRERLNPEGVVSSTPVVADLFGDGVLELAVGCFAGAVVVIDARTGEELDRAQFGVESHELHLSNSKIPRFIRDALRRTGEPVNCLAPVELDGNPGAELVLACSDGYLYAWDPGSGDVMWRFETSDNVYDSCVLVDEKALLAWDAEAAYLLDGASGLELPGHEAWGGVSAVIACDRGGASPTVFVQVGVDGRQVTARTFGGVP
jgi:outer membrane protein assembly factor BamB